MTGAHRGSATEVLLYISVVWLVARNIFVRIIKTIKPKSAMKSFPLRYIVIPGSCFLGVSSDNDWRRQWQPTPVLLPGNSHGRKSLIGCSPWGLKESDTRLSDFTFTFHFHALEKEMATHSSVLAWRIPWTEEPGGLPSVGSHRVRHDWSDLAAAEHNAHNETFDFVLMS